MVDLHSHILPQVDDGACSCEEAVSLINMEIASGVDTIVLTPHYYIDRESSAAFARKREAAFAALNAALLAAGINVNLVLGAEVFLCPDIIKYGSRSILCYAHTGFMLVEFPSSYFPDWAPEVLLTMIDSGVTPVIAHVERYEALLRKPELLYGIVRGGALVQVNADSLVCGSFGTRSVLFTLMENNLIHFIVTDTHSVRRRPPLLHLAMETVIDRYGREKAEYFELNSRMVISNKKPLLYEPRLKNAKS